MKEPRQFERVKLQESLFVHAQGEDFSAIGKVKDIGYGGVAFEYMDNDTPMPEVVELDIFSQGSVFRLTGLRCQVVYDQPCGLSFPFSRIHMRKSGLRFENLSEEDANMLSIYLGELTLVMMRQGQGILPPAFPDNSLPSSAAHA